MDTGNASESFFYNWSEFTLVPLDWLRCGIVTQRTRAYQTDRDVQRGLLAAFSYNQVVMAGYLFNPDDSRPIVVLSFGIDF